MSLEWHGDEMKRRMTEAAKQGVNATLALCVIYSKQHHGGWQNQTGTAEGSINIYQYAQQEVSGVVSGLWGSSDVAYFIHLELRFFTLRHSADVNYPRLGSLIAKAFARGG
jgi:hypothetical protein